MAVIDPRDREAYRKGLQIEELAEEISRHSVKEFRAFLKRAGRLDDVQELDKLVNRFAEFLI